MAGTWKALTHLPTNTVCTTFLLTDGTVLAQGVSTNKWYKLTPNANGSYRKGTWSNAADSTNGPLYYASGILRDGRLIVAGGEYNFGHMVWLNAAEIYNPVTNSWMTIGTPPGWTHIGDAPACILPDGRLFVGRLGTKNTAIYDPVTNSWTAAANKLNNVTEESWSLLPDGTVHAVDCSSPPKAEKYIIAADLWVDAGSTPNSLVDSITEIGASVLLPDGRLFAIGATGYTALYTMPAIANQVGTWAAGPNIPQVNPGQALGAVDAPSAVLPNGKVLLGASPITIPASFQTPTFLFEFDPATDTMTASPLPSNHGSEAYWGRMLVLPTGQILWTDGTTQVEIYTPDGACDEVWRPTITNCPNSLAPGSSYKLRGRQLNGLTQCVYYGDDATQSTNYPIIRLEATASSKVYYCRTFNFSTMGLQTGTVIHSCKFQVPSGVPIGNYRLVVVANGIPSRPFTVQVGLKGRKELKLEIKEKFELIEKLPREVLKQVSEIQGKEVREEQIDFGSWQEQWLETVREMARQVDDLQTNLGRSFITPEERPEVAAQVVAVPRISPIKVSLKEIEAKVEKRAFNDKRPELPLPEDHKPITGHLPHSNVSGISTAKPDLPSKPHKKGKK
jgi:hypothetical protein